MGVYQSYSLGRRLYELYILLTPKLIKLFIRIVFAVTISYTSVIGKGACFPHWAQGVILHDDVKIGNRCPIPPSASIGGRSDSEEAPFIEDGAFVGAGAAILGGPVTIDGGSSVRVNAVVLKDVPSYSVAVGVPAKIIPMEHGDDC